MKDKMITQLRDIWDELTYGLRRLCLRPSPDVRLFAIVFLVIASCVVNIWFIAGSIYSAGRRDAGKEFLKQQEIDSINLLKQKMYEYGKSNK
ncbi:MAG: TraL conjugative transposon family protein [Tannerellaceae bacterium]|jgi:hypothetical protein|nr:TraL conjugative transposon family protein [Tannerellaceae bacterium]